MLERPLPLPVTDPAIIHCMVANGVQRALNAIRVLCPEPSVQKKRLEVIFGREGPSCFRSPMAGVARRKSHRVSTVVGVLEVQSADMVHPDHLLGCAG
jgi:hypothetical protein